MVIYGVGQPAVAGAALGWDRDSCALSFRSYGWNRSLAPIPRRGPTDQPRATPWERAGGRSLGTL